MSRGCISIFVLVCFVCTFLFENGVLASSIDSTPKSPAVNITHVIKVGDNFISPAVKSSVPIQTVLAGLTLGVHYSDVKRFNAAIQLWESYAKGNFTHFEPGKGYNIIGLRNCSFSYGKTESVTKFTYDFTGARVKKVAGSITTIYLGKDYEKEGNVKTKHIFLGDKRIATKKSSGEIQYIHSDQINSSNVITDAAGNRASLMEYDPYGLTVTQTGSVNPKHKYTGQEEDSSTKLYYYGSRYYDPQLGRMITADAHVASPTNPQDLNRYSYARNNPVKYTDPTGNFPWLAAIVGAIIGAISSGAQSNWNPKAMLIGAGIGFLAGSIGGAAGSSVSAKIGGAAGAVFGGAAGGAAGGAVAGGLNAAYYGGDIGQGILRGAAFGAMGGLSYGAIDGFVTAPGFRWELVRVAIMGASGGGLSELSGGEFWEGVAFSSAIAGSRFLYRISLQLSGQTPTDPSLRTSDGSAKEKTREKIIWGQGSAMSDVGEAVAPGDSVGIFRKYFTVETAPLMKALSKWTPGLDPLAEMHDPLMHRVNSSMFGGKGGSMFEVINKGTIAPAYGVTVLGALNEPAMMATFEAYGEDEN